MMLLALLLIPLATATEILYYTELDSDEIVGQCAQEALDFIAGGTCVNFALSDAEEEEEGRAFTIVQSGECSWRPSNRTIHLAPSCISASICAEMIGAAIGVERPRHDLIHYVGSHHNCSRNCNARCEHGGMLNEDTCVCSCGYGFEGERCEKLTRARLFSDGNCGTVEAEDAGLIELSTYPGDHPKATFCQWLIKSSDPWATIELDFSNLDMDNEDIPPGAKCGDILTVYGAGEDMTIPCDGTVVPNKRSASNWVMVELRTNTYSLSPHRGPSIKYTLHSRARGFNAYAGEMTAGAVGISAFASLFSLIAAKCLL